MSREGAMLEDLRTMSALMGEVAMAYYYQHPDGRQRGPYMLPNTGGGNLEACGYEQVLLYTRPAPPSANDMAVHCQQAGCQFLTPCGFVPVSSGVAVDERDNDDLDDAAFAATVRDAIAGKDGA